MATQNETPSNIKRLSGVMLCIAGIGSIAAVLTHLKFAQPPLITGLLIGASAISFAFGLLSLVMLRETASQRLDRMVRQTKEQSKTYWFLCDATGNDEASSAAFKKMFSFEGTSSLKSLRQRAQDQTNRDEIDRLQASALNERESLGEFFLLPKKPKNQLETTDQPLACWRFHVTPDGFGGVLWQGDDITDYRNKEAAWIKETSQPFDYFDGLPVGFLAVDGAGQFTFVNRAFSRWVGRSLEDMQQSGLRFSDILNGENLVDGERAGFVSLSDSVGDTFSAFIIRTVRQNDEGMRAVVLLDSKQADSSQDLALLPMHHDVPAMGGGLTPWLFDEAPVGMAVLDGNGAVIRANAALESFFGLSADEIQGKAFVDFAASSDRDDVAGAFSKLILGTAKSSHAEVRFPGRENQEKSASLFATRTLDSVGDISGIVLHVIDETEHKHLEVQFTQSQKMQAIGQLAGGVAHDFNNLLTAMIGFSDLLLLRHGPDDPAFDDIMQIKQNANRATNLVRQLLAFSRKQTLEPVVLDPTESLADLSHLLGRLIGERIELKFAHEPDTYLIKADRGQFDQVIINLTVNARDAMPGGGSITLITRNEIITSPVQRDSDVMLPGAYVVIDVADTGTGISRENLERIFEPFYSTKEVGAGTGLGLSTVYGIIRQSEGFIFVDSAIGHGTTFSIYLPAYGAEGVTGPEATAAADKALAERRETQTHEKKIDETTDLTGVGVVLLVEDEDAVRMFGTRALRNKGYTVLEADNGESGLDMINSTDLKIDIIVSDVVMPGMDGHTFVQLVRQEMPDMKVILMSGYAEDVFREEISRDPSIHFLAKPFSLKALAGTVKDVLSSSDSV